MTIFFRKNSAFKPYKAPQPMETGHSSCSTIMVKMINSSRTSPPPPSPPLQLFPMKSSFLRKQEEEEWDFRGKKQVVEEADHNGFSDLRLGLGRNPLKELSLIQRYPPPPPVLHGRKKRIIQANKDQDLVLMEKMTKKLKRDYQDMPSTSKQACSSVSTRSDHNVEQETFSSSIEIETSNNSSSTLTHEEQRVIDRDEIEEGEIPTQRRRTFLFEKLITANDIDDFSRLLVPINSAATFFPQLEMTENGCQSEMLKFTDNQNCNWDIKYECWVRSKTYVLTIGWKTFVTHHKLQFNDMIRVYKFADDGTVDGNRRYGIDFYRAMKTIRLFGQDICVDYRKMDAVGFVED